MKTTAADAARRLPELIRQVNEDREPIEICSDLGNAVLLAAAEYSAWKETEYLFRSPANARRLLDSYEQAFGKRRPKQ